MIELELYYYYYDSILGTRVIVLLSPRYSGHVEGLCGDFDGNYDNEFADLSSGQLAATPREFAQRWKTANSVSCPEPNIPEDFDPCTVSCSILLGSGSRIRDLKQVGTDMAQVKCHGGASLRRFLPFPNSPIADRKGIRAIKTSLQLKTLM